MKEGYKKTEVGVIPVDWDVKKLGEIAHICYGKSQKEVESIDGKYKILGTGGLMGYANDFLWNKPSVLIGRKGTIDKPQYIEEPFWTVDTLFYTKIKEDTLAKWLYYYLSNIDLKKYNEATGVPSLSTANLNTIKIITPPLKEQEKIADILSTVDSQIDDTVMLIDKCKVLKKGLMQRLLTKGIGHKEFKKSEVGEIPVEWEVKKLEDVAEFTNGKAHEKNICEHSDFIVINSKFISTEGKIKKYSNVNISPLRKDDITMVMSDVPNGRAIAKCYMVEVDNRYTLNQRICCLRTKILNAKYLYYYLNRNKYFLKFDDGVKQTNLRKEEVLECKVIIPPIDEQEKISQILTLIDEEIKEYENKKQKLEDIKKGLMQQLLTGKIRVI